jgi:hypothetical protein
MKVLYQVRDALFRPDPDRSGLAGKIPIAIMIAIEKPFRIDRTLIFLFQPDFDEKFSGRP